MTSSMENNTHSIEILLDLNLPCKDEREVPAYDLHANCYVTKPVNLAQFVKRL